MFNGLASTNGLAMPNGLALANGLSSTGNGLMTTTADGGPSPTSSTARSPAGDSFVKQDHNGVTYTFPGGIGLCPQWKIRPRGRPLPGARVGLPHGPRQHRRHPHPDLARRRRARDRLGHRQGELSLQRGHVLRQHPAHRIARVRQQAERERAGRLLLRRGGICRRPVRRRRRPPRRRPDEHALRQPVRRGRCARTARRSLRNTATVCSGQSDPDGYKAVYSACGVAWNEAITVWRNSSYAPKFDTAYAYRLSPMSATGKSVDVAYASQNNGTAVLAVRELGRRPAEVQHPPEREQLEDRDEGEQQQVPRRRRRRYVERDDDRDPGLRRQHRSGLDRHARRADRRLSVQARQVGPLPRHPGRHERRAARRSQIYDCLASNSQKFKVQAY